MHDVLATMVTMTTYGTWLRGDLRGWVDDGVVYSRDPILEASDTRRMKHPKFLFSKDQLQQIGQMIGDSLVERLSQRMLALTVQTWHIHFVVAGSTQPISNVVKCAKDAVRWGLRPGRPIWTDGYDKRYCFDDLAVERRVAYIERHNVDAGLPPKPWNFIETPQF